MDNITHTLVGAALAESGLKRRTALGAATLMIGANFPDIDVLALLFPNSIDVRRGLTHGLPAHLVLPFVLAWLMGQYDRRVRLRRNPALSPADPRQLLILATVAIWTHPALDFMNIYGMRWLMPFVNRWYYADALFIVDLWLLLALIAAVVLSRRWRSVRPARAVLGAAAVYIVAMLLVTSVGRSEVRAARGPATDAYLVGPTPLQPWAREVILPARSAAGDDIYVFGRYALGGSVAWVDSMHVGDVRHPALAFARAAPEAQGFLNWARYPFFRVDSSGPERVVRIADARYVGETGRGWASVVVVLP